MADITTGIDIIEVKRIQNLIEEYGERFLNKVFTTYEIAYCEKKGKTKYQHYAARFAAKEAVYKALSKNSFQSIEWKKIEILNETNGRPKINEEKIKGYTIDISLSHLAEFAMANAVVVKEEKHETI